MQVETRRVAPEEAGRARSFQRLQQLFLAGFAGAQKEILPHGPAEQFGVLPDIAESGAQFMRVILAAVHVIDGQPAPGGGIKAADNPAQRRLAGRDPAEYADAPAPPAPPGAALSSGPAGP